MNENSLAMVEQRIDRVLTQYRESPKLLFLIRTWLNTLAGMSEQIETFPSFFTLDTAEGDQLTMMGKRLGWPREHCVCDVQPVFGFECEGVIEEFPISGFCDGSAVTWEDCGEFGTGSVVINDDEIYRKFLKVRCYQMQAFFDIGSLNTCLKILFGDNSLVLDEGNRRVVIAPGRTLTNVEIAILQLYPRVLPVALGIEVRFHFDELKVFGFGDGWGGFCEEWVDAAEISTSSDGSLVTEDSDFITTGVMTRDAPWLCEIDVKPHSC